MTFTTLAQEPSLTRPYFSYHRWPDDKQLVSLEPANGSLDPLNAADFHCHPPNHDASVWVI